MMVGVLVAAHSQGCSTQSLGTKSESNFPGAFSGLGLCLSVHLSKIAFDTVYILYDPRWKEKLISPLWLGIRHVAQQNIPRWHWSLDRLGHLFLLCPTQASSVQRLRSQDRHSFLPVAVFRRCHFPPPPPRALH